ncbi:MAG: hypothetical protein AAF847_00125 [Bacteroidota bacterium]
MENTLALYKSYTIKNATYTAHIAEWQVCDQAKTFKSDNDIIDYYEKKGRCVSIESYPHQQQCPEILYMLIDKGTLSKNFAAALSILEKQFGAEKIIQETDSAYYNLRNSDIPPNWKRPENVPIRTYWEKCWKDNFSDFLSKLESTGCTVEIGDRNLRIRKS